MSSPFAKRMTAEELDVAAARLEQIQLEEDKLRSKLQEQVEEFGFTPPRAEKSKRLVGTIYQFTVTRGLTTEIKDAELENIRQACLECLFKTIARYKLADDPKTSVLPGRRLPADAPRTLRLLFTRAVDTKDTAPRLRIDKAERSIEEGLAKLGVPKSRTFNDLLQADKTKDEGSLRS